MMTVVSMCLMTSTFGHHIQKAVAVSDKLAINKIRTDGGTQPRKGLDSDTVEQYTQAVKAKVKFPPVTVYHDGAAYWLADGFHRLQAHRNAQKRVILAEIRQGNLREAILHSAGANATHGLRRSNEDKRRAVNLLLDDPEWSEWSDRAIAKRCNVSNRFVSNLRNDSVNVHSTERKFTHPKTGETSTMQTANIGVQAKQIIIQWLITAYDTNDPALIASHARYIAKNKEHMSADILRNHLTANGTNADWSAIVGELTAIGIEQQSIVDSKIVKMITGKGTGIKALSRAIGLVQAINELAEYEREAPIGVCEDWIEDSRGNERKFWKTLKGVLK